MSHLMGYIYSMCIISQAERSDPPGERAIILRARIIDPQGDREPVRALRSLRGSIMRMVSRAGQKLDQESQG